MENYDIDKLFIRMEKKVNDADYCINKLKCEHNDEFIEMVCYLQPILDVVNITKYGNKASITIQFPTYFKEKPVFGYKYKKGFSIVMTCDLSGNDTDNWNIYSEKDTQEEIPFSSLFNYLKNIIEKE